MRKLFIIIGFLAAIIAVVLSVTPLSNIAIFPAIVAFVSGLIILYFSKKQGQSKKVIQYIFLLTIISIAITTYKAVYNTTELGDMQELEQKEADSVDDAVEELEGIEIDTE